MKTSDFDYSLPPERIAQVPVEPRHNSRLLVLDRNRAELEHRRFYEIGDYLRAGDLLVINQTRVIPARLHAHKPTGGKVEILLLHRLDALNWEALVGGKNVRLGQPLSLDTNLTAEVVECYQGGRRLVRFNQPVESFLERSGEMPLPPYIHTRLADPERYQTVYARQPGSAAAPTAGLHFTKELLDSLQARGVRLAQVLLHVGLDTFAPVTEEDPRQHQIHTEWCQLDATAAQAINETKQGGGRVIAVGTTSVRTLESAAVEPEGGQWVQPSSGPTRLFILPGYTFRVVDGMVTNFHLPKSTLLMLVSAFSGRERTLAVYKKAIELEYRFFSFGDAMLIL